MLFYHTKRKLPTTGNPEYYARSGFIHPLQTPRGIIVTDDFPVGHVHQHGIMTAWVNTTVQKYFRLISGINIYLPAMLVHKEVVSSESGPVAGVMKVKLSHMSKEHGEVLRGIVDNHRVSV